MVATTPEPPPELLELDELLEELELEELELELDELDVEPEELELDELELELEELELEELELDEELLLLPPSQLMPAAIGPLPLITKLSIFGKPALLDACRRKTLLPEVSGTLSACELAQVDQAPVPSKA